MKFLAPELPQSEGGATRLEIFLKSAALTSRTGCRQAAVNPPMFHMYLNAKKQLSGSKDPDFNKLQLRQCLTSSIGEESDIGDMSKLIEIDRSRRDQISASRPTIDLSPKWETGVISKVKAVWVAALTGAACYSVAWLELSHAQGMIELTGNREGSQRTSLIIRFSEDASLAEKYSFVISETDAVGIIVLPAQLFSQYLQIAQLPNAHFRIGGTGSINGIASEPTIFQALK